MHFLILRDAINSDGPNLILCQRFQPLPLKFNRKLVCESLTIIFLKIQLKILLLFKNKYLKLVIKLLTDKKVTHFFVFVVSSWERYIKVWFIPAFVCFRVEINHKSYSTCIVVPIRSYKFTIFLSLIIKFTLVRLINKKHF